MLYYKWKCVVEIATNISTNDLSAYLFNLAKRCCKRL